MVPVFNNINTTGITYQWESSEKPISEFATISGATNEDFVFSEPISTTKYYRRKATLPNSSVVYSNTLKLEVVSVNWENLNYRREHLVTVSGQTSWNTIDELPIGEKLQQTIYYDGLGRPIQHLAREMGAPLTSDPRGEWSDRVKLYAYDANGRQPKDYLPYSTSTDLGSFKFGSILAQNSYHDAVYDEEHPYTTYTYDGSPLNATLNSKPPGSAWNASPGNSAEVFFNIRDEDVRFFEIGYNSQSLPHSPSRYGDLELIKTVNNDVNGKKVLEYYDKSGSLVLRKVQLSDAPSIDHSGWICSYYVYDDFGNLRATIEGEAVVWLEQNGWTFSSTGGDQVFYDLCYLYVYDEKGRVTLKKTPGCEPLMMIYNKRDLLVFMQDGNQRKMTPPEWTVNIYDPLDRLVISTLYKTTNTVAFLQEQIDNATSGRIELQNFGGGAPLVDLVVSTRDINVDNYSAQMSVEFVQGFESAPGDEFETLLDPMAVTTPVDISLPRFEYPIDETELNDPMVCTILKLNFYDNYTFSNVKQFDHTQISIQAYSSNADPIYPTERVWSLPTGSMVRVLESDLFLNTTVYYDEKGRIIQSLDDNIKSGIDVLTAQYRHDGTLLSTSEKHSAANSEFNGYTVVTNFLLDKIGRVSSVEKKFGDNSFRPVASYTHDDMGRLKDRRLAPGYTGIQGREEIELLRYSYNIVGSLTGINKDYALKTSGSYNKWGHFFGQYLEYDNKSQLFNASRLDGKISGTVWNTQGDDAQRFYNYEYDNAGRFIAANFMEKQTPGGSNNNSMDFSVTGNNNGKMEYDLNGNIKSMIQMGVVIGSNTPVKIDELSYTYHSLSNKLHSVTDNGGLSTLNGTMGDFKNGSVGSNAHYEYDDNGNLIIDWNKSALIEYNYLDKPRKITLSGKGVIDITYDANGSRLQRKFTPTSGSAPAVTTSYISDYVYEGDDVQFINFEEGRLRVVDEVNEDNGYDFLSIDGNIDLPGDKRGAFDYYISDHLSNVRMIVTEQTHIGGNACTMETARAANEETIFGQVDANGAPTSNNEVAARFAVSSIPGQSTGNGWENTNIGDYVSRIGSLSPSGKIGPNTLLKVMAGDEVSAQTQYYYQAGVTNGSGGNNLISSILTALTNTISGSGVTNPVTKGAAANITGQLNSSTPFVGATSPDASNNTGSNPKAYLNILFFDERFKFVEEGSASIRVLEIGSMLDPQNPDALEIIAARAPKNGYAYIYVSNESDEHVYFDNLQVTHERGRLIEENHYYAYGLKISAISSKKLGDIAEGHLKNNYLYQGAYSELDDDIGWNDFELRSYDPQLGRFMQVDPYDQFTSPYVGMGNDPVSLTDPSGGWVELPTVIVSSSSGSSALGMLLKMPQIGATLSFSSMFLRGVNPNVNSGISNPLQNSRQNNGDPNQEDTPEYKNIEGVTVTSTPRKKQSWWKRNFKTIVNVVQTGLDFIGSSEIPILSQIGDLGSAFISATQGDLTGAGMSLGGMFIPGMSQLKAARSIDRMRRLSTKSAKAAKGVGRVFTQTAKDGDLLFYSTKIGDDVIEFGGNFSKSKGTLTIKNFDIDGALTNKLGIRGIKDIITDFGRQQGVNQVIIQGAKRTTGANPGKIPSQLIFKID